MQRPFAQFSSWTWLASVSSLRLPSGTESRRYKGPPRPLLSTSSVSPSGEFSLVCTACVTLRSYGYTADVAERDLYSLGGLLAVILSRAFVYVSDYGLICELCARLIDWLIDWLIDYLVD